MDSHRQSLFAPLDVPSQVVLSIPSLAYHLATKFRAVVPLLTAAAVLGSIAPIEIDAQVEKYTSGRLLPTKSLCVRCATIDYGLLQHSSRLSRTLPTPTIVSLDLAKDLKK